MKIPVYDKNGELEGFVEPISETAADSAKGLGIICGFLLIGAVLVWLFNFAKSVLNLIAHWQALAVVGVMWQRIWHLRQNCCPTKKKSPSI